MTQNQIQAIGHEKYPTYVDPKTPGPKFSSVSLYDQPFSLSTHTHTHTHTQTHAHRERHLSLPPPHFHLSVTFPIPVRSLLTCSPPHCSSGNDTLLSLVNASTHPVSKPRLTLALRVSTLSSSQSCLCCPPACSDIFLSRLFFPP